MSPTEAALRAAVAAAPDAALPRLVYADYLDDHDFPHHAAALRLDVALAAERPWADRYWLLKADRDAHTPDGFPGDLGWLSDRPPLLVGVPDDWRSRWRAVRAFVSRWWNVPLGDVGRWDIEVDEAERAADRERPPGVKEWVTFAADLTARDKYALGGYALDFCRLTSTGLVCLLQNFDGDEMYVMGQGALDPPVHCVWHWRDGFENSVRIAGTTAGFALFHLMDGGHSSTEIWGHARHKAKLTAAFSHAGRFDTADVFERPGAAVLLFPSQDHMPPREYTFTRLAQAAPAAGVSLYG